MDMILAHRDLPDGRVGEVVPLTYSRARLTVRRDVDTFWLEDQW